METIEAIKKLVRDSSASTEAAWGAVSNVNALGPAWGAVSNVGALGQFQDTILDLNAQALAMYKLAVLEADRAETVAEMAEIWTEAHAFFARTLSLWQAVAVHDPLTNKLAEHYKKTLAKLKEVSEEHRQFFDCSE
jgi:hypothetical protein